MTSRRTYANIFLLNKEYKTNPSEIDTLHGHQRWLLGHLATRKLGTESKVTLSTPEQKPVVIDEFSDPVHGVRVNVSRGSRIGGDLDINRTVVLTELPGGNLPDIHPIKHGSDAQAIINDLRKAS